MFRVLICRLLLCYGGLICVLVAPAQAPTTDSAWFARAWQTEDGLPEHTIVGLEQTPDGYLWVATHRSLCRFDGMRFQEFAPASPAGPTENQIRAMLSDRHGRLWLAKDGGIILCIETNKTTRSLVLKNMTSGAQARSMAEDGEGNLWIADNAGGIFRVQGEAAQSFGVNDGLAAQGICWLTTDRKGQLWFSQNGNIGGYRNGHFVTFARSGQASGRIAAARQGGVWLCTGSKLYRYEEGGTLTLVTELILDPAPPELAVSALYEDQAGRLWIGIPSSGLFRFDPQGLKIVATSHPNIINVLEDVEGNIWVGTRGGGLNRLSPRALQLIGPGAGLPFAAVQSVCEDGAGGLWAVGQNGALARRRNDRWELVSNDSGWSGGEVVCVTAPEAGTVLIATRDRGLFRYQNDTVVPHELNPRLNRRTLRSIHAAPDGALWLAVNGAVARYRSRDEQLQFFPLPAGVSDVRALAQDTDGNLWMGTTSDGLLLRLHGDTLRNETTNVMSEPRHIRCLQVTRDGSLWFGFAGQGLGRLKNGRFFQFRSAHGLWDEFISQILADDQDRLWLAGNRGVFQVTLAELEAVAAGRESRLRSVVFGRGDGVANLQATFGVSPAAAQTRDGRLLMPMLNGLVIAEPRLLRKNSRPPPVVIERLAVNGQVVTAYDQPSNETTARWKLGPGVSRLEVEFAGLSLTSPENVMFRYQLEGLDQDWVEAGTARVARYPRIPPGDYRFHVTACNHDGIWNETGAAIELKVMPHLWESTWFRLAAAASAAGLFSGGVLLTMRQRYRRRLERLEQQRALERERTRIAQDLHDDLGAGLVEINFGSELAQDPTLSPEEVREHSREIGARARDMVTALDEIVWAVNPKHDSVASLATYFCQFAQHFLKATSVRCHLDVARDLPPAALNAEQRHSLFLAFKEALSNVVQHSGATDLRLGITANQETLVISIGDNGRGFAPAAIPARHGADGLGNMQRRLQQLGGRCEVSSRAGAGTTVVFRVPLDGVVSSSV